MRRAKKLNGLLVFLMISFSWVGNLNAAASLSLAPDGKEWVNSSVAYFMNNDPNLDPNWDWRQEYYTIYWDRQPNGPWTLSSPFYSEFTGGVAFTKDYEPEDGWVLLFRNFGSEQNYLRYPYFLLYNKYTGLLRAFILVDSEENYTTGNLSLAFGSELPNTTALLTHASHRAWAADLYKKELTAVAVTEIHNGYWIYVDFATAYDPHTKDVTGSALEFRLDGVNITDLFLNGTLSLTQVLPKSVTPAEQSTYTLKDLVADGKHVAGFYNTFQTYQKKFKEAADKQTNNELKQKLGEVLKTWTYQNLPLIGVGIGLVDLFIGGGREKKVESPVPMVFSGDMSLKGTMKERNFITKFSIQTPGTKHQYPNFVPLYDYPLGIFNLRTTPVLQSRTYWQKEGPNLYMEYTSYKVMNDLDWVVNPDSGLKLKEMKAAIVFRLHEVYPDPYALPLIPETLESGIYEIESSTDGKYVLRTRFIPFYLLKDTAISVPPGTDITIKVMAVLERKDAAPGTQPVLFIADYEPVFVPDRIKNNFPWSPYQLPSFPDQSSKLENGGFEKGLTYWESYGDGSGYGTAEEGVEGVRSAYFTRPQATNHYFGFVQRQIVCEPNTTYKLTVWVKTEANTGSAAAALGNWGSPNSHQDFGWTGGYTDWKQISGTWKSGPKETSLDIVLYGSTDFSGKAYFDNVVLEKVWPPLEAEILGPSQLGYKQSATYSAEVSGGSGKYLYEWAQENDGSTNWIILGRQKTQMVTMFNKSFTLKVKVSDSISKKETSATLRVINSGSKPVEK